MIGIIDRVSGTIDLGELSKFNGKSELENAKTITKVLMMKAEVYGISQKVVFSFPKVRGEK